MGANEPYIVWIDNRTGDAEIYYAATTSIAAEPITSASIDASQGGIVGTDPALITSVDDVCVEIPAGALWADTYVTISKIDNPPAAEALSVMNIISRYEFGPSCELEFAKPVTITIPYWVEEFGDETAFWYNPQTGDLSESGISNIEHLVISDTLHAIRFQTLYQTRAVNL